MRTSTEAAAAGLDNDDEEDDGGAKAWSRQHLPLDYYLITPFIDIHARGTRPTNQPTDRWDIHGFW